MGKGFLSILTTITIAITSSSISAGCSPSSQQAITSSVSETRDKSLEEMVADHSPLGLTAVHVTKINTNSLPGPVQAMGGVRLPVKAITVFHTVSDTGCLELLCWS